MPPPSRRSASTSSGRRSPTSRPTSAGFWRSLASRLAAALARARERRHPPGAGGGRQRRLGSVREGRAETALEAARRHDARVRSCRASTSATSRDALTPDEALAILERQATDQGGARSGAARDRLSRPTRRRSAGSATRTIEIRELVPRRARGRLDALQGQGRRPDRRRPAARPRWCARRSARDCRLMIDANQRWDVGEAIARVRALRRVRSLVDGRADEPGRRPRPRRDREGRRADPRRDRRALREPRASSSSCSRPTRSASARSTACRLGGVNENLAVHADGGEVRRAGLPARRRRRPVRDGAAPCRCSTSSRSPARREDRVIEFVDHLHEHFVDPVQIRAGPLPPAVEAGLQHDHARPVACGVRVPARIGMDAVARLELQNVRTLEL